MTAGSVHVSDRSAVEGLARIGRVVGTILCLAGVVVLAVALRSGLYEYFHGGGRALRGLSEVLMPTGGLSLAEIAAVGLLGLVTTSSVMLGAVLGLYLPFPKKVLAGVLAFAAGSLIAALAIELGFEGASDLVRHGASVRGAWVSIAGGFAAGAVIYYVTSLFLDQKGAALQISVALSGVRPGPQAPGRRRKARFVVESRPAAPPPARADRTAARSRSGA